jgi:hypothetical protein
METSKVNKFCLIPKVKELRPLDGRLNLLTPSWQVTHVMYLGILDIFEKAIMGCRRSWKAFGPKDEMGPGITINMSIDTDLGINTGIDTDECYRLTVTPDGIDMRSPSRRGLFRAAATCAQLVINDPDGIPCVDILDWPDFPVRGFYHDVTRGRVPTLNSLKRLVDNLAFYKINQLQLYVEHSFAFSMIPEFSALSSEGTRLTAFDIRELDKYCADNFVDLVPSLSTFGHLYELLRLPRFERLNELHIHASETPRDLWDRMAHYTLNVSDPGSFELVKGMIEEYAPLFSSQWFNICCDETFDLGKGKNAERAEREGVGRLYVEFVNKIIGVVKSVGKKPMLWGDIVLKHPEYISEFPADTVFLNWDYAPDAKDESVKKFKEAGVTQYVCPGVQAWSRFAADVDRACANISRMTRFGREAGAAGVLNTNWGDCGHINLPANSYHGLAFGAAHSWNGGAENDGINTDTDDFDSRFQLLHWGVKGDRLGKLLRELGGLSSYHFGNLYAWIFDKQCLWYKEDDVKSADAETLKAKAWRARFIARELEANAGVVRGLFADDFEEYVWSAEATHWLLNLLLAKKKCEYGQDIGRDVVHYFSYVHPKRLINVGKSLLERFKTLWLKSGRESELRDVVDTFEAVFDRVRKWVRDDDDFTLNGVRKLDEVR